MISLIDTDWVVDYLKGKAPAVQLLESLAQEGAAISLITYGEIYEGIYFGNDPQRHEKGFRGLLQIVEVLSLDLTHFGRVRSDSR